MLSLLGLLASRPAALLLAVLMVVTYAIRPVLSAMLNDSIPSEQRATIISLQSLLFTLALAGVQPVLYAIGGHTSMALALFLAGMLMAVMGVPILVLLLRVSSPPTIAVDLPAASD